LIPHDTRSPGESLRTPPPRAQSASQVQTAVLPDERVAALQQRIAELKARQVAREKREDPVVREIPKVHRRLRKFAQLAMDNQRPDIANSALAFMASMDRILRAELGKERVLDAGDDEE
jgi:molecular chaperone GrpE (heat shock protein)